MKTFSYVVNDKLGIHARPAGQIVNAAKQFTSTITLEFGSKKTVAKSVMGVMALGVKQGNEVKVSAEGEDEAAAIAAMEEFFKNNL